MEALWEAKAAAEATSERPILWQILATLAEVEEACGDAGAADRHRDEAWAVIADIAEHAGELLETLLA